MNCLHVYKTKVTQGPEMLCSKAYQQSKQRILEPFLQNIKLQYGSRPEYAFSCLFYGRNGICD
jgi:hypothetical protein